MCVKGTQNRVEKKRAASSLKCANWRTFRAFKWGPPNRLTTCCCCLSQSTGRSSSSYTMALLGDLVQTSFAAQVIQSISAHHLSSSVCLSVCRFILCVQTLISTPRGILIFRLRREVGENEGGKRELASFPLFYFVRFDRPIGPYSIWLNWFAAPPTN